jgi:hypothetical protein
VIPTTDKPTTSGEWVVDAKKQTVVRAGRIVGNLAFELDVTDNDCRALLTHAEIFTDAIEETGRERVGLGSSYEDQVGLEVRSRDLVRKIDVLHVNITPRLGQGGRYLC